jgi:hypothetical protein
MEMTLTPAYAVSRQPKFRFYHDSICFAGLSSAKNARTLF